jgi:hypothetical protein
MKKVIWTALAAIASAAAASAALRVLDYALRRFTHEQPPEQPKWARWFVGGPLKKGVEKTIEPAAL